MGTKTELETSDKRPGTATRIFIDDRPHDCPEPSTGEALYRIAQPPAERRLYLEAPDNDEDLPVRNDPGPVQLRPDDRLYSAEDHERGYSIIVNGRRKIARQTKLTFAQVLALAFEPVPSGPNWVFTVTYRNGPRHNHQGTLLAGKSVRLRNGMIFNVTATDKS